LQWDQRMQKMIITRDQILRKTLLHIQLKRCQYIDDFPERVTSVFEAASDRRGIRRYEALKSKLYHIDTNFFRVNKISREDFFRGLYQRVKG